MGEPINLFEPSVRSNPFPAYERLRNEPLQQIQPGGYWAISRHEDAEYVLKNPRWRLSLQTHKMIGVE